MNFLIEGQSFGENKTSIRKATITTNNISLLVSLPKTADTAMVAVACKGIVGEIDAEGVVVPTEGEIVTLGCLIVGVLVDVIEGVGVEETRALNTLGGILKLTVGVGENMILKTSFGRD